MRIVMRIECEIEECVLKSDKGVDIKGVRVTCSRCGHSTESFGREEKSVKRCLALLREECPEDETNFYVTEEDISVDRKWR